MKFNGKIEALRFKYGFYGLKLGNKWFTIRNIKDIRNAIDMNANNKRRNASSTGFLDNIFGDDEDEDDVANDMEATD
jgi:hypothetical protein